MNPAEKTVMFFATGFYSGKIPFAPGTFGSIVGVLLFLPLARSGIALQAAICLLLSAAAVYTAHQAEKLIGTKDPGCIVIDEIAGIFVTFLGIQTTPVSLIAGFLLFRIMDIWKPFPVRRLETIFPGGAGIVIDDIAAGIYANILLRMVIRLIVT